MSRCDFFASLNSREVWVVKENELHWMGIKKERKWQRRERKRGMEESRVFCEVSQPDGIGS